MQKKTLLVLGAISLLLLIGLAVKYGAREALAEDAREPESLGQKWYAQPSSAVSVDVIVNGRSLPQYDAKGRLYIEALENAEYELRIHNPFGVRVAVALSVDGMNTIDARHTSAQDAHKWVIQPYGTITVQGWQMSSENARHFYFTTERESYGAKIGQTANLGVISAVVFKERKTIWTTPVVPGRSEDRQTKEQSRSRDEKAPAESDSSGTSGYPSTAKSRPSYPPPDDESAATGIGRTVGNSVQWIKMDLEPRPVGEVTIRYEYRAALVRLGILPRDYPPRRDVLMRRESAEGFEPKFCPQP
ncbi:MAG TPA: hypothetical protein VJT71_07240 [Pyrinomonadaceae bacterium]|nr:hypothetical protein [Pyrinomonadaceae bacterium]